MISDGASPLWPWLKTIAEQRRSARAFLAKPVSEELLSEILETSLRTPSGGNLQPWNVMVLKGAMKARLGAAIRAAYADKTHKSQDEYPYYPARWESPYNERRQAAADQLYTALDIGRRDVAKKRSQQAKNYDFFGAPIGLLFTLPRGLSQGAWVDMGIYLGQLQMLLEGAGLNTCLQASFISYGDVIRQVAELPEGHIIVCGMAVGYADETHPVNAFRTDRKSIREMLLDVPRSEPIGARILKNGDLFKSKTALKIGETQLSWQGFADRVSAQAAHLIEKHAPTELALSLRNGAEFLEAFMAGQVAGKTVQVLDPTWPMGWSVDAVGEAPIVTSGLPAGGALSSVPEVDPETAFYTGFTSGSTGRPKGFVRSMNSWLASFDIDTDEFALSPDDVIAAIGNFTHSLPLYAAVRGLYEGVTVVAFPTFHPKRVLSDIAAEAVSIIYAVPTQLDALCRAAEAGVFYPTVRWVLSSGAKCSEELFGRLKTVFPNAELAEFYGSSELSFISVAKKSESLPNGSIGRPVAPVQVKILGSQDNELSAGEVGRVFVNSPLKFLGYLGADHYPPRNEGFYTGDMGYLDAQGLLYLTGRVDRVINSKGRNIFPEKIEGALLLHPAIKNAAVFGVADPKRGEDVIAILQLEDTIETSEILKFCREHLPDYMLPHRFYCAPEWMETSSGKSDYPNIKQALLNGEFEALP